MAEWLKALVSKTSIRQISVSWVQIPLSPPNQYLNINKIIIYKKHIGIPYKNQIKKNLTIIKKSREIWIFLNKFRNKIKN